MEHGMALPVTVLHSIPVLCWRVVKRARKRALAEEPGLHLLFFQLIDLPNLTMHVTSAYFCLLSQMLFRRHRFQEFPGHVTDKRNYPLPIWIVICCTSVSVKFVSNSYILRKLYVPNRAIKVGGPAHACYICTIPVSSVLNRALAKVGGPHMDS